MNRFTGDLIVGYIDGEHWRVESGFTYRLGSPDGIESVTIPRGFITDFASMPMEVVFRSPGGKWDKPAVVHDALYRYPWVMRDGGTKREVNRGEADAIFLEAMGVAEVSWWAKRVIYLGVRMGGWKAWAKHRKEEADVMVETTGQVGGGTGTPVGPDQDRQKDLICQWCGETRLVEAVGAGTYCSVCGRIFQPTKPQVKGLNAHPRFDS